MRILHTSDWHLGRTFHGTSLHELCKEFVQELVELVSTEHIDAVLISGDVYDQAQPRPDTVSLFSHALSAIVDAGAAVVATSGNHDSALRLGFASDLLRKAEVYFLTDASRLAEPVELTKDGVTVAVFGIPYLEPRAFAGRWDVPAQHTAVLSRAMQQVGEHLTEHTYTASIAMAHCFASSAQVPEVSDSERNISVGGLETVPASVFETVDYAALGHLHGKQKITETVRYSGSPLAFSFSEAFHRKGAWMIDVDHSGIRDIREHLWQTKLELIKLRGTLDEVLSAPEAVLSPDAMFSITLTDAKRPPHALEKLKESFANVSELYFEPQGAEQTQRVAPARVSPSKPIDEVCEDFFEYVLGNELTPTEHSYMQQVLAHIESESVSR